MAFSINNISTSYNNKISQKTVSTKSEKIENKEKNFDEILISSNKNEVEEKKFTESLVRNLTSELKQTDKEDKIAKLKEAISADNYKIDAKELAAKILLLKGD